MAIPKFNTGATNTGAVSLKSSLAALNSVGNQITNYQDRLLKEQQMKAAQEQLALDNARADARLGIAQNAEGRAAQIHQQGLDKQKAIADAANVQLNVLSGDDGQERFENYINTASAIPEYDQAIASLDAQGITGSARNAQIDQLRDFYSEEINAKDAAIGGKLEDLSKDYSVVNEASGYDGLKYNIADDTYKQRVYDNLAKTGLFTTEEALKEAAARDSMMRTPTAGSDNIKAMRKDLDNAEKNELDILKNTMERKSMSSGSSKKGKDYSYKVSTKDIISDAEKDAGMFSITGLELRKMFNEVNSGFKGKGLKFSDAQLAEAAYNASSGENDAWTKGDFDVKKPLLEAELAAIVERDGPGGSNKTYNAKLYSKYGPEYASNARAISSKYAEARKQLNAGVGGNLKGTGLAELESKYNNIPSEAANNNIEKNQTANVKVPKTTKEVDNLTKKPVETVKTKTKADTEAAVKDIGGDITTEVKNTVSKQLESINTAFDSADKKSIKDAYTYGKSLIEDNLEDVDKNAKDIATKQWTIIMDPKSNGWDKIKAYNSLAGTGLMFALSESVKAGTGAGFVLLESTGNAANSIANAFRSDVNEQPSFTDDRIAATKKEAIREAQAKLFPSGGPGSHLVEAPRIPVEAAQPTAEPAVFKENILPGIKRNPDMDRNDLLNASLKLNQMSPAHQQLVFKAVQDPSLGITARLKMLRDAGLTHKEANEALGQVNNLR